MCFFPHTARKRKLNYKADIRPVKCAKYEGNACEIMTKETNINDMPNEILLEILSHLRHKDLLSATLVNRNFNNLICNTRKLMNKINVLYVNDKNIQKIPKLTRRYEKLYMDDITEWHPELFKCIKTIGSDIRSIVLFSAVFFDDDFKSLIECFPNLEELEVWDCHPGISPMNNYCVGDKIILNKLNFFTLKGKNSYSH